MKKQSKAFGPSIEVKNLKKIYHGVKAIEDVSFSVQKGEVVGFLGPNGAGKTTTMRILCGLIPATSGCVNICGISVAWKPHETKRHIGYMPEHNPLPEDMRVFEYLHYRAALKEIPRSRIKKRVHEVLEVCELNRKAYKKIIGSLSKGYRQRVGIADAILAEPSIVIMDEPTIGLDPHQIIAIRQLIHNLRGKMTIIFSSHILPEIEASCDRIIIINQGRVVANGTTESLRKEFIPKVTYRIKIKANPENLGNFLTGVIPDLDLEIDTMQGKDSFYTFHLRTSAQYDLGTELIHKITAHPEWELRELCHLKPNLEDIFMAATKRSWDQFLKDESLKDKQKIKDLSQEDLSND